MTKLADANNNSSVKSTKASKKIRKTRNVKLSRSARAGLHFPVGRIHRMFRRGQFADRISNIAPVYMAGVLEYLVAEVVELSGDIAVKNHRRRIQPRDISLAARNDLDISSLFTNVTIAQGGYQGARPLVETTHSNGADSMTTSTTTAVNKPKKTRTKKPKAPAATTKPAETAKKLYAPPVVMFNEDGEEVYEEDDGAGDDRRQRAVHVANGADRIDIHEVFDGDDDDDDDEADEYEDSD